LKPITLPTSHPKYRSLNGYGNNLKNPYWGMAGMPFNRFGPKNYNDNAHTIKKSVTGKPLPNPRDLVQNVLKKAQIFPRTANQPNQMYNYAILTITHDVAFQVPVEAFDNCKDIRCCTRGNKKVLDKKDLHSACMPISIPEDDPFYKPAGVGCLNMVRAEVATSPAKIHYGEILNKVTSFMDISIVYGSSDEESQAMRTKTDGKLNLGPKNTLPSESNGKYTSVSNRLTSVVQSAIWPVIFARHHNVLCDSLKEVNPHWSDDILFEEARRINIALFQKMILGSGVIEAVFGKKINETYKEDMDASTILEFSTSAYRFLHFNVANNTKLRTQDETITEIPMSETFGRMDLIEDHFDDLLRGEFNNPANVAHSYYDESKQTFEA
jgi:peroxidase